MLEMTAKKVTGRRESGAQSFHSMACNLWTPPYVGTFTAYDGGGFNDHLQLDLAVQIRQAVRRGARVVISNSLASRDLYNIELSSLPGYRVDIVTDRRSISRDGAKRGVVEELLISVG